MKTPRFSLILPAAGSGSRMGRETPKPYLKIGERSILEHTLSRFAGFEELSQVIIVTSEEYTDAAGALRSGIPRRVDFRVVPGGSERQHSISHALQEVDDSGLVVIHDAVRPFVTTGEIRNCLEAALVSGAALTGVPVSDTIKKVNNRGRVVHTPGRDGLWHAQTPQVFRTEIIREAYKNAGENGFLGTDDASLVEYLGEEVVMVEGSGSNIKITYPSDMILAEFMLNRTE